MSCGGAEREGKGGPLPLRSAGLLGRDHREGPVAVFGHLQALAAQPRDLLGPGARTARVFGGRAGDRDAAGQERARRRTGINTSGATCRNDKILNDQAVCFFQLAEGADLGTLTIGRKGQPTRFDFDETIAREFVEGGGALGSLHVEEDESGEETPRATLLPAAGNRAEITAPEKSSARGNRIFITHGKNRKILEQVKEIVAYGKFEPVVAQEHETAAKPVPEKVMDDMRSCQAAVIHVSSEGFLKDAEGREQPQLNGNVLIEIGAAMALYGKQFILLVEDGVRLPSNLQGLYECRYSGNELSGEATMKLLKAFNAFR